jgi:hypothetical protein
MIALFARYGSLDAKIASKDSFPSLSFTAVAGPTTDGGRHPPFQWSTTNIDGVPTWRTIDKFDFEPVKKEWTLTANTSNKPL